MTMKANEFVKKFGWEFAVKKQAELSQERCIGKFFDELTQLVKSWKIVKSFGGLEDSKAVSKMGRHYKYLKKAIADVEDLEAERHG